MPPIQAKNPKNKEMDLGANNSRTKSYRYDIARKRGKEMRLRAIVPYLHPSCFYPNPLTRNRLACHGKEKRAKKRVVVSANERERIGIYHRCADGEHNYRHQGLCIAMYDFQNKSGTRNEEKTGKTKSERKRSITSQFELC